MTEIVEQLRAEIVLLEATGAEAADEIERLRHDLTITRLDRDHARAERDAATARAMRAGAAWEKRTEDWFAATAERDQLREALAQIEQWAEAYPNAVFPEVNVSSCREKFGDDALFSRLHASWARHLTNGIGGIAKKALEGGKK